MQQADPVEIAQAIAAMRRKDDNVSTPRRPKTSPDATAAVAPSPRVAPTPSPRAATVKRAPVVLTRKPRTKRVTLTTEEQRERAREHNRAAERRRTAQAQAQRAVRVAELVTKAQRATDGQWHVKDWWRERLSVDPSNGYNNSDARLMAAALRNAGGVKSFKLVKTAGRQVWHWRVAITD